MPKLRAVLIGLVVTLLIATSLAFVVVNAQPHVPSFTKVADGHPPTPTPQSGPCPGHNC